MQWVAPGSRRISLASASMESSLVEELTSACLVRSCVTMAAIRMASLNFIVGPLKALALVFVGASHLDFLILLGLLPGLVYFKNESALLSHERDSLEVVLNRYKVQTGGVRLGKTSCRNIKNSKVLSITRQADRK